ncbi:bifunctional methylenetetrahydrofolate dehydrogenase/methenyltetrahydrofolate cyclohydrolase FolD [bacterium]|nr:bifunctional methylenetetrahydrofolate dehydrogenase/methenyltetrahydrofolate cyclohydrolase FolD [bacterium]
MTAQILNGKSLAKKIRGEIKQKAAGIGNVRKPGLAAVLVGEDPASAIYVKSKEKTCKKLGFHADTRRLPADISRDELLAVINELNNDSKIDGILLQMPIPEHLDKFEMLSAISIDKDVDGFNPISQGRLFLDIDGFIPCTPRGIIRILKEYEIPLKGANAVILGRSLLVGKPVAMLLMRDHATISILHSRTRDLSEYTKRADIVVVAAGVPNIITADMIKPGAVIIDVGINRLDDGSIAGDVDFKAASEIAGWITPVPGGVGPMTIAMLMENTWLSYAKREGIQS